MQIPFNKIGSDDCEIGMRLDLESILRHNARDLIRKKDDNHRACPKGSAILR